MSSKNANQVKLLRAVKGALKEDEVISLTKQPWWPLKQCSAGTRQVARRKAARRGGR